MIRTAGGARHTGAAPRRATRFARLLVALVGPLIGLGLLACGCTTGAPGPAATGSTTTPTSLNATSVSRSTSDATTATGATGSATVAPLPVGASEKTLSFGNLLRMYRVYRPARLSDPAPLVVMLHGGLGSARLAELAYGWDALADREGFVVLYPDSFGGAWNVGGGCCGSAPDAGVDDVAFVAAAIADLERSVPIDPLRRYAAGMSNGGMLTYRLACDTTLFAAIGPVAATQLGDCPNPAPISIMHVHGTDDTTVPLDGRPDAGLASIVGQPIPAMLQTWRNIDRCGGTIERVDGPVTTATAQCPRGRAVVLVLVAGGGHSWPGVGRSGPLDASPAPPKPGLPGSTGSPGSTGAPASTGTPGSNGSPTPPATAAGPALPSAGATPGSGYDTTAALWAFFVTRSR